MAKAKRKKAAKGKMSAMIPKHLKVKITYQNKVEAVAQQPHKKSQSS